MMNTRETYDRIAEDWINDHARDTWWIAGTDAFVSLLPAGARVLDVGCAGGAKAQYLTDKGLRVVGIDNSEKMIAIAKRNFSQAEFRVMSMSEADVSLGTFDEVFVQAALLHILKKEVPGVLEKLSALLNQGGYMLYIAVKELRDGKAEEEIVKENDYGYDYERFFSYYTMDELKGYLRDLCMDISYEQREMSGKTRWLQIVGQKR